MQDRNQLQFHCQGCQNPVNFSILSLKDSNCVVPCPQCGKKYAFNDEGLKRQLQKFVSLCKQLQESEEILSSTSVGIDIGEHHVKVPYKILLTRLNSTLDLVVGNKPLSIVFRFEPLQDMPKGVV